METKSPSGARFAAIAVLAALVGTLAGSAAATPVAATACSPSTSILKSPRAGSKEVQAKALNDRGDVVGFSDWSGRDVSRDHVEGGKVAGAVDLGVLPGYVSSEAFGVTNDRVVFGLLYDKRERTFPFRWANGRMTVLKAPNGSIQQVSAPDRNAINERGEMAGTLLVAGNRRAVRWTREGKATFLSGLPGHRWTNAWSIGRNGVVSGWSRKLASEDGENNPVLWDASGKVIALKTAPGRADGAAEAANRSGLTVGYLGTFRTDGGPETDQAAVWRTRTAEPLLMGPTTPLAYGELVDVNDRGQAVGMMGAFTRNGFPVVEPAIWQTGSARLRTIPSPPCLVEPTASSARSSTTSTPAATSSATSSASPPRTSARCAASTPSLDLRLRPVNASMTGARIRLRTTPTRGGRREVPVPDPRRQRGRGGVEPRGAASDRRRAHRLRRDAARARRVRERRGARRPRVRRGRPARREADRHRRAVRRDEGGARRLLRRRGREPRRGARAGRPRAAEPGRRGRGARDRGV